MDVNAKVQVKDIKNFIKSTWYKSDILICPALHMMLATLAGIIKICNSFQSFHKFLVEQLLVMHTDVLVSTS
jgi:hypothetical protein